MIEVGEYVRTNTGKIDKVINNNYYMPQYIECEKRIVDKGNIVKHSKNIIDLLQEGDIVNKVYMSSSMDIYVRFIRDKQDIETILTKEQYMQNCYKIPEKKSGND